MRFKKISEGEKTLKINKEFVVIKQNDIIELDNYSDDLLLDFEVVKEELIAKVEKVNKPKKFKIKKVKGE